MTSYITAFDALDKVPDWDSDLADIEVLKGGLTNRTYLVRQGNDACVLRIDSESSSLFGFDREAELPILEAASQAGVAPRVLFADPGAGILVTEYLPGRVWEEADLQSADQLEALAELLRRVHALPVTDHRLDITQVAARYERNLQKRQGLHVFAMRCVGIIEAVPQCEAMVCCHNDIVAANVIESDSLKLIDWEFSCDHDPLFDLASAICFHNLDQRHSDILLDAYTGGADQSVKGRLAEQVRVFDAIQWLWLATLHLVFPKAWQARRLEELQQRLT